MPKDILISGGGPGGLACAIEAAKKFPNATIKIIELRESPARPQRLRVDEETANWFFALREIDNIEDNIFFETEVYKQWAVLTEYQEQHNSTEHARNTFQADISKMEDFLWRKIRNYKNIQVLRPAKLTQIDAQKQTAMLTQADGTIHHTTFDYLFSFDGPNHPTLSLLEKGLQHHYYFQSLQARHIASGSILLEVTPEAKQRLDNNVFLPEWHFDEVHISQFKDLGWEHSYPPRLYVFPNSNNVYYLAGEIPTHLYMLYKTNRAEFDKQIKAWADLALHTMCGFEAHETKLYQLPASSEDPSIVNEKKQSLITSAFPVLLTTIDDPIIPLSQGGYFACGGDCSRVAYYQLAHGVSDSIRAGRALIRYMTDDGFDADAYRHYDKKIHQHMVEQMNLLNIASHTHKMLEFKLIDIHKKLYDHISKTEGCESLSESLRTRYPSFYETYGQYLKETLDILQKYIEILPKLIVKTIDLATKQNEFLNLLEEMVDAVAKISKIEKKKQAEILEIIHSPYGNGKLSDISQQYFLALDKLIEYCQTCQEVIYEPTSFVSLDHELHIKNEDGLLPCTPNINKVFAELAKKKSEIAKMPEDEATVCFMQIIASIEDKAELSLLKALLGKHSIYPKREILSQLIDEKISQYTSIVSIKPRPSM